MKISFSKPKMLALLAVSLFAVSCSVKGEIEDLVEEIEETTETTAVSE